MKLAISFLACENYVERNKFQVTLLLKVILMETALASKLGKKNINLFLLTL